MTVVPAPGEAGAAAPRPLRPADAPDPAHRRRLSSPPLPDSQRTASVRSAHVSPSFPPGHAARGPGGPRGRLSPMRQLYLHAGLPKTGTTYLQALFLRNRAALEAAGLGFGPHMDPATGSHLPRFVAALEARGAAAVIAETEACPGEKHPRQQRGPRALPADAGRGRPELGRGAPRRRRRALRGDGDRLRPPPGLPEGEHLRPVGEGLVLGRHPRQRPLRLRPRRQAPRARGDLRPRPGAADRLRRRRPRRHRRAVPRRARPRPRQGAARPGRAGERLDAPAQAPVPRRLPEAGRGRARGRTPRPAPRPASSPGCWPARRRSPTTAGASCCRRPSGTRWSPRTSTGNRALVARHGIADPGGFVELPDPAAPWTPPAPITPREIAAVWRELLAAARAGRDPLRAAWLAARLARPFAAMAARSRRGPARAARGTPPADAAALPARRPAQDRHQLPAAAARSRTAGCSPRPASGSGRSRTRPARTIRSSRRSTATAPRRSSPASPRRRARGC